MRKIFIFAFMMTLNSSLYAMERSEPSAEEKELHQFMMNRDKREFSSKKQVDLDWTDDLRRPPDCKEIVIFGIGVFSVTAIGIYYKFMMLEQS